MTKTKRTFRYKYTPTQVIHKVAKKRNGKPWNMTICGFNIDNNLYVATKDAITCKDCLYPTIQTTYYVDPNWANADPNEAFIRG